MERRELLKIIRDYLGPYYYYNKVNSNLKDFKEQGITEEEIASILKYWYGELKKDPSQSGGGIRIVEYIREDAKKYWAEKAQKQKMINSIPEYKEPEIAQINIQKTPIKKPTRMRLFELP